MDVTGRPETLVDVLTRRAEDDPAAVVATFLGEGSITVGELIHGAERVARQLSSPALGLGPGAAVVTCLRPGTALATVVAGVARAGCVEVPAALDMPGWGGPRAEVPAALDTPGSGGLRAAVALLGTGALAANPALATLAPIVLTVDDGGGPGTLDELRPGPLRRPPEPGDPALVLSTSGTTGRPKGVLLPHFAGVRHARRVSDSMGYGPGDVLYNAFPWNHVNIRHTGLLAALVSGARLLAVPRFSASAFWATCRAEGVTAFNFMGAVAAILLRGPGDRDHQVTRAYGGPAPRWLAEQFLDRFGVELVEAYACTELGDVTSNRFGDRAFGTAGKTLPEYDVTVRDNDGRAITEGEIGAITVRARQPHISTLGYTAVDQPPPEWITTGDLGRFDGDRLVFCGRHSDVVRRRGENISAWDVETVVGAMPGVREAAAAGVPSEFTEEDLLVAVAGEVTAEDVHAWCRDRLPRHAWPRYVAVLDALPRNAATKVSKPALRAPAVVAAATDLEHLRRAPEEHLAATPEERLAASPEEHLTATSEERLAATSEERLAASPEEHLTATSEERLAATSEERLAASPEARLAATPEEHLTATPGEHLGRMPGKER
ncbi:AMP-binding protein [Actinoplanes sp. TRM 88003]|uniref:AMP-binding protein n=1 Tax=Paractinoplanes aksuensis TaxID=2939490 RepID=A0ABT1E343_9ACTN|nr:AMP-binding protein [Actinoplanes aksuensis]MCO8277523.1 AMP-binding protein [Actinoplanes aksuensis]